jgi:cysteine desulfurase/selenocysteine lyase
MTSAKTLEDIRADFPILNREVNGNPLVYFDNAASAQKPKQVVDAISNYYFNTHSNVHRGVNALSQEATDAFEAARKRAAKFINARSDKEIIFTTGTTNGINLVASSLGQKLEKGSEIIISTMEHHSNMVPWQMMAEDRGMRVRVIPIDDRGQLDMEAYADLLNEKTALVAVNHVSNSLGTINPVEEIIRLAHDAGALVLIDGAQSAPHMKLDVQALDADFYAVSGHKIFGPTGSGFLYGKEEVLSDMPPYMGGGEMIARVTLEKTTYAGLPFRFEAGTPNMAAAIGMAAAMDYMEEIGYDFIQEQENKLLNYAVAQLKNFGGIRFIGEADQRASLVSFLLEGAHPYDVGSLLDQQGIAVRTGHHCTEPVMDRYGIPGTVRASFAFYNTIEEIDRMMEALERTRKMLL